jgi:hypothetical protein
MRIKGRRNIIRVTSDRSGEEAPNPSRNGKNPTSTNPSAAPSIAPSIAARVINPNPPKIRSVPMFTNNRGDISRNPSFFLPPEHSIQRSRFLSKQPSQTQLPQFLQRYEDSFSLHILHNLANFPLLPKEWRNQYEYEGQDE